MMITYCTNIHPGESWADTFENIHTHLWNVKKVVSPNQPFPIGLRLSHRAAIEIDDKAAFSFQKWCEAHDCYVPTINGFPFGSFHAAPIKDNVYLPDWRYSQRVDYTKKLAELLAFWIPSDMTGSISTVPVGYKYHVRREEYSIVRQNLLKTLEHLEKLHRKSAKKIILAMEPEPSCILETTQDVITFWERMKLPPDLTHYLGICFDCCHLAVEFETPAQSLALLSQANIQIAKVQISSALRMQGGNTEILKNFQDSCYLHQVVIRDRDGKMFHYPDIPDALRFHSNDIEEEWRIHFHVPIFVEKTDLYTTTRFFIEETLPFLDKNTLLEVETYTWHVLPPELRTKTVTESIIREIQWLDNI